MAHDQGQDRHRGGLPLPGSGQLLLCQRPQAHQVLGQHSSSGFSSINADRHNVFVLSSKHHLFAFLHHESSAHCGNCSKRSLVGISLSPDDPIMALFTAAMTQHLAALTAVGGCYDCQVGQLQLTHMSCCRTPLCSCSVNPRSACYSIHTTGISHTKRQHSEHKNSTGWFERV